MYFPAPSPLRERVNRDDWNCHFVLLFQSPRLPLTRPMCCRTTSADLSPRAEAGENAVHAMALQYSLSGIDTSNSAADNFDGAAKISGHVVRIAAQVSQS